LNKLTGGTMRNLNSFRESLLKARLAYTGDPIPMQASRDIVFMEEFYEISEGVTVKESKIAGIEILEITPKDISSDYYVIYIHGGGYVTGDPVSETSYPTEFMKLLGAKGISIRYRLAPENPFPAALDDVIKVYQEVIKTIAPSKIILIGSSAGGGLSVTTCLKLKELNLPQPKAIVLLSPWLDLLGKLPSYKKNAAIDALLDYDTISDTAYLYAKKDLDNPLLNPLTADLSDFPITFSQVGTHEMLIDDSIYLTKRLTAYGVKNKLDICQGGFHAWQLFNNHIKESQESIETAVKFIKELAS